MKMDLVAQQGRIKFYNIPDAYVLLPIKKLDDIEGKTFKVNGGKVTAELWKKKDEEKSSPTLGQWVQLKNEDGTDKYRSVAWMDIEYEDKTEGIVHAVLRDTAYASLDVARMCESAGEGIDEKLKIVKVKKEGLSFKVPEYRPVKDSS